MAQGVCCFAFYVSCFLKIFSSKSTKFIETLLVSFPENVTFLTCFALLHEIKVSNKSKNKTGFLGEVPVMTGQGNRKGAPEPVRRFYYFAFDFINFAVLLAGRRTAKKTPAEAGVFSGSRVQPRKLHFPAGLPSPPLERFRVGWCFSMDCCSCSRRVREVERPSATMYSRVLPQP